MSQAKKSLEVAVGDTNRPDEVRIPAAACLGYLGDNAVLRVLKTKVSQTENNSASVRLACVKAVGEIIQRLKLSIDKDDELSSILKTCLDDEDENIRLEAARAIGKAQWQPEVFLNLEETTGPFRQN